MNSRIIKTILKKKHQELCASITDEKVRKMVESNSIITGGSIVSLLLKERVKDYDYYFTDLDTATAVAKYYVKEFTRLNPDTEIKPEVDNWSTKDRVRIRIQSSGITSEKQEAEEYIESLTERLEDVVVKESSDSDKPVYRPVFLSDNAITLSNKVQLVIRFYGNAEEIHKNYDFAHCTCYWVAKDNKLVLPPHALESIITKELFYQGSLYPLCSVIRTRKFLKRGWHINAGQYLKMCFQLSEMDLSNIEVLQEQLTGVDAAYFTEIIEYCSKRKEQDPDFSITMPYLCKIVDRIFGEPTSKEVT